MQDFDNSKFEVFNEGFQFEDSYNSSTTYQDGDVVTYGGYTYVYINTTHNLQDKHQQIIHIGML